MDEVNKQECIQSHIYYKKLLKLALKGCQWLGKISMKFFHDKHCSQIVFDLSAGNLGGHK